MRSPLVSCTHSNELVDNIHQQLGPTGIIDTTAFSELPCNTVGTERVESQGEDCSERMQKQIDELQKEIMVRSEVTVQLAEKVVTLRRQLQRCEAELYTLRTTGTPSGTHLDVHNGNDARDGLPGVAVGNSAASMNAGLHSRTHSPEEGDIVYHNRDDPTITVTHERVESPTHNVGSSAKDTELNAKLAEMESQAAVWKQRVKEALKASQGRERALLAENIALSNKLQELQEKLNEASLHVEASALQNARYDSKTKSSSQADLNVDRSESNNVDKSNTISASDVCVHLTDNDSLVTASTSTDDANDNLQQQNIKGDINEDVNRSGHSIAEPHRTSHTYHHPNPTLSNAPTSAEDHTTPVICTTAEDSGNTEQPMDPTRGVDGVFRAPPLFPYPPQQPWKDDDENFSPVKFPSRDADMRTEVPPFIVAVDYSTDDGWSMRTKVRVEPGMTITYLKEYCCAQFHARHQLNLDPVKLCVRYYHERAKRHVVLSPHRELHSFACFYDCEREKLPIMLFLAPQDNLSELVRNTMKNPENFPIITPSDRND